MSGSDWLNSKHEYKPSDPCWIIVDSVNSPTGRWRGEIVEFNLNPGPENGYINIIAKITDPRVDENRGWSYIGRSPTVNYRVMPRNPYIDSLFEWIDGVEAKTEAIKRRANTREEAFKEAVAAAAAATKATINMDEIIERAVKQALSKG